MTLAAERPVQVEMPSITAPPPAAPAEIIPLPRRTPSALKRVADFVGAVAGVLVPPIVMAVLVLLAWQIACSDPYSLFPGPLTIWEQSHELIVDPFFKRDGLDQGLFWHVLTSLQRVAIGFSFAAVVGVTMGVIVGASTLAHRARRSDFSNSAHRSAARLAPDFARDFSRSAAVSFVRDLHHGDLASDHQYGCRHP